MRWSLPLSLAAFLFTIPAFAASTVPIKPKPRPATSDGAQAAGTSGAAGQPAGQQAAANATSHPATARSASARTTSSRTTTGRAGTRAPVRTVAFRSAGAGHAQAPHPGLGGSGAEAGDFCGHMTMPPGALREVSRGYSRGHAGLDLMAPHGSPIRAAAAGSVIYAGWYYAYGNIVDIRHADGVVTRYAHMSAFAPGLSAGTAVQGGEEIGQVGATGHASGPHVHFEVRIDGHAVDPKPYLALASCTGTEPREEILEASAADPAPVRRGGTRGRRTSTAQVRH